MRCLLHILFCTDWRDFLRWSTKCYSVILYGKEGTALSLPQGKVSAPSSPAGAGGADLLPNPALFARGTTGLLRLKNETILLWTSLRCVRRNKSLGKFLFLSKMWKRRIKWERKENIITTQWIQGLLLDQQVKILAVISPCSQCLPCDPWWRGARPPLKDGFAFFRARRSWNTAAGQTYPHGIR